MQRTFGDALGPGQAKGALAIRLAEVVCQRGSTINVRWVLGHHGVDGNEQHARGAAESTGTPIVGRERVSLAALKKQHTDKAHQLWKEDIIRRNQAREPSGPPRRATDHELRGTSGRHPRD